MLHDITNADATNNFPVIFISITLNFPPPADSDMNEIHTVKVAEFWPTLITQLTKLFL